uniref:Putative auxilin-like protein 1 isoform X3 n=1 Tax=Davidia involucrata TaxID=16924 RepID=A0A5B7AJS2_DAVIN
MTENPRNSIFMENLSHSLSKKSYNGNGNGNGFAAKTVYDDVFGGPPKFGVPTLSPRVEDYTQIFGSFHASRASSIPILDLPVVDEVDVSFDVRSSKFDYSEVFSGFNGLDLAVSYEELFNQSKAGDDSSEEAWTPAQSESLSDESGRSACSEKNQSLLNGDSYQSFDGIKQFNISYHKANQRSKENMSNGMTHVTQLLAVPGFIYEVNETLPKLEDESPSLQVTNDLNLSMDFNGRIREGKQFRKTMSHPANSSFGIQTFESDLKPLKGYGKTGSSLNGTFLTISDISLRTQPSQMPPPSRPPPVLAVKEGDSGRQNSKLKASKSYAFERTAGDSSPPFFDVEVDASSSAAASVAAMKDAMEKAQAKLKSAKELMERKKEGLQSRTKLGLKNDIKDKEGEASKNSDGSISCNNERVQGTCDLERSGIKAFAGEERQKVMKTTRAVSDSIEGEGHINLAKKAVEKKHGKEYKSSHASHKTEGTVAWREAVQFYEVVEADKSKKVFEQSKDEKILVHNTKSRGCEQEKKAAMEAFEQQEEDNRKIKTAREACKWKEKENKFELAEGACEWEEYKGRSEATKKSCRQEEHRNKIKVAQKVCAQEENEKKLRAGQQHGDIEKMLTEADKYEECENLVEIHQKENEVDVKQKLKEVNERIKNEKRLKDAHDSEERKRRLKETVDREKYEKRLIKATERAENEKRQKEALEQEEKEKQEKEAREREKNGKRQKEARKDGS